MKTFLRSALAAATMVTFAHAAFAQEAVIRKNMVRMNMTIPLFVSAGGFSPPYVEGAGELANGFISVGGASTPELASDAMKEFVDRYTKKFGEYNEESNTKVYALDYILETMKANPAAIDNVDEFKKTIDTFEAANPYLKDPSAKLKYVGTTSFGQKRQVAVPMVVNEYKDGKFETLFVGTVD